MEHSSPLRVVYIDMAFFASTFAALSHRTLLASALLDCALLSSHSDSSADTG